MPFLLFILFEISLSFWSSLSFTKGEESRLNQIKLTERTLELYRMKASSPIRLLFIDSFASSLISKVDETSPISLSKPLTLQNLFFRHENIRGSLRTGLRLWFLLFFWDFGPALKQSGLEGSLTRMKVSRISRFSLFGRVLGQILL